MITALDAGKALSVVATRLLEHDVVQPEGYTAICNVAQNLKSLRKSVVWTIKVDRGQPILFQNSVDKNGSTITPMLVAESISIDQTDPNELPFKGLDMAMEVGDSLNQPISRWHIDLANESDGVHQPGPLFHLQYGGHNHDARHLDHPLKVPRWCHPPMELALFCEIIAANFFEDKWIDFRDDPNWCHSIHLFQRLCFPHYLAKLQACCEISSSTNLNQMWVTNWK